MKGFVDFVKTCVAGGFFVVLPIVAIVMLLGQMLAGLGTVVDPIANLLPVETVGGVEIAFLLAIGAAIAILFLTGLVLRTRLGARANDWFERQVLNRVPGYTFIKNLTERFAPGGAQRTAVLARLSEGSAWVMAFLIEEIDDEHVLIFVPLAPTPTIGSLYVLPREDLHILEASMAATVNCMMQWGIGAREIVSAPTSTGAAAQPDPA